MLSVRLKIMVKKIIFIFFALFLVIIAGWYIPNRIFSVYGNKITRLTAGSRVFYVEIVSSEKKLQKGLGDRKKMCDYCGMLFKFKEQGRYSFWMKDMRFPLDIIWLKDGEVVYLEKNVSEKSSKTIFPNADADSVLEINAGISDEIGLKKGDKIGF